MKQLITAVLLTVGMLAAQAQPPTLAQIKANMESFAQPARLCKRRTEKKVQAGHGHHYQYHPVQRHCRQHRLLWQTEKSIWAHPEKNTWYRCWPNCPTPFNHISQIFIDTTIFTRRIADSLANSIIARVNAGTASFADMAMAYSMGGEGATKGDLGWIARGAMLPDIEKEIERHKTGEVFKIWSMNGMHILKKQPSPNRTPALYSCCGYGCSTAEVCHTSSIAMVRVFTNHTGDITTTSGNTAAPAHRPSGQGRICCPLIYPIHATACGNLPWHAHWKIWTSTTGALMAAMASPMPPRYACTPPG